MNRPYLEFAEAATRTVKSLRVYDDPPYGREVHLAFTDGTELSIDVAIETQVKGRHYRSGSGEFQVLHEHQERVGSQSGGR